MNVLHSLWHSNITVHIAPELSTQLTFKMRVHIAILKNNSRMRYNKYFKRIFGKYADQLKYICFLQKYVERGVRYDIKTNVAYSAIGTPFDVGFIFKIKMGIFVLAY